MDLGLTNKNALICASSQGLGRATAAELANEGANVVLCGRTEETLREAHEEIAKLGAGKVVSAVGDLSTEEGRATVLDTALSAFGHIDICVTNTGGPPPGPFEMHEMAAWETAFHQLLASAVGIVKGVLPGMKERQWGRIIAITSYAIKQPVDGLILSNAVRASVVGLCRTLANELGPHNITVNNVMPGFTRTERLTKLTGGTNNFSAFESQIPLGRVGEPEEFAAMMAFLASERASYITGVSIPVDGGAAKGLM